MLVQTSGQTLPNMALVAPLEATSSVVSSVPSHGSAASSEPAQELPYDAGVAANALETLSIKGITHVSTASVCTSAHFATSSCNGVMESKACDS